MTNQYNITVEPGTDVATSSILSPYTTNSDSFEIIRRLNATADGVGATIDLTGNWVYTLNNGDQLPVYLNFSNLDTSGSKRVDAIYINNLIFALYKSSSSEDKAGLDSVSQLTQTEMNGIFSTTVASNSAMPVVGTSYFASYGSSTNGQTLGNNLWSYDGDGVPGNYHLGTMTVITSETYSLELHVMGTLILKTIDSSGGIFYNFLSFAHDPRMSINPS